MAKRLTEADIRRIFREEAEREKRVSEISEEAKAVLQTLWGTVHLPLTSDISTGEVFVNPKYVEWPTFIQKVIDTYWEVVEEDLNEPYKA